MVGTCNECRLENSHAVVKASYDFVMKENAFFLRKLYSTFFFFEELFPFLCIWHFAIKPKEHNCVGEVDF